MQSRVADAKATTEAAPPAEAPAPANGEAGLGGEERAALQQFFQSAAPAPQANTNPADAFRVPFWQQSDEACIVDDNKLYWCVSSPTMKDKPVSYIAENNVNHSSVQIRTK